MLIQIGVFFTDTVPVMLPAISLHNNATNYTLINVCVDKVHKGF